MLKILLAIKNNNVSKIPNYDTTYSRHLRKLLRSLIKPGSYVSQLNISLEDLLKGKIILRSQVWFDLSWTFVADERGKWWVVGSAWSGKDSAISKEQKPKTMYSQELLSAARKQGMNTEGRQNIFCILMSAEVKFENSIFYIKWIHYDKFYINVKICFCMK